MPSTFTSNTGIEKLADGEQTGLWGQSTNNNFDIVDRAANGVGSIALTGTSLTLTTSNGILSDGQYSALVFTGSPGGTATITIAPNTAQKTYFVRNDADQSVVLTQGSGGTVTLPAGRSATIACTGTGAGSTVFDITGLMNTATSSNTANAVVQRDGSGAFAGALTGNASTATTWQTPRNLTINGVSKSVNGSADVAFTGPEVGAIPSGGIIMWSGSVGSIPTGWLLCDGTNGTPDLQNRFIVGAGDAYAPNDTGGTANVVLTEANLPSHTHSFSATTGSGGNHQHTGTTASAGGHRHYVLNNDNVNSFGGWVGTFLSRSNTLGGNNNYELGGSGTEPFLGFTSENGAHAHSFTTSFSGDHTHTVSGTTGAAGSSSAHENRPPYYALAYIMKA